MDDDKAPGANCFGNPVGKHQREPGCVAGRLLRPKFSQPLLIFSTQMHFVALLAGHSLPSIVREPSKHAGIETTLL